MDVKHWNSGVIVANLGVLTAHSNDSIHMTPKQKLSGPGLDLISGSPGLNSDWKNPKSPEIHHPIASSNHT